MHHYLEFMEECERLKDLFLLEGTEGGDDLAEMTPEEDSGDKDKDKENSKNKEGDDLALEDDTESEENESNEDDSVDLDTNADLGDILGDESLDPKPEQVNAEQKPGAINIETLYKELTQGEDNIYDRTAKSVLEKFPDGKCEGKDVAAIITIGIKKFLKNKNYADIGEDNLKALVNRIGTDLNRKLAENAEAKKKSSEQQATTEAIFYRKENQALTEGWKDWLVAAGIGLASLNGGAHAATAESAPLSTHSNTSKMITNNRPISQDSREMVNTKDNYGGKVKDTNQSTGKSGKNTGTTSKPATQGGGAAEVPMVSNYKIVEWDDDTVYQVTQEQLAKMKADGNVPPHYQIFDKNAKDASSGKTAKAAPGKSASQTAVKQQAKVQTKAPSGKCPVDAERCGCGGQEDEDIDVEELVHKAGHKAVDVGIKGAKTAWGGLKGAAVGLWRGAKNAWNSADKKIEQDHDKMIADRNK